MSGIDFKMFKWVPDGIYDYSEYFVRYVIVNNNPTKVIAKAWLDKGGPEHESPMLRQPWGSFPDFPIKPKKK